MRWFAVVLLLLSLPVWAQTPPDSLVDVADVQPVLIGGLAALQRGVVYPEAERRAGAQGRVIVQFVVDEAGAPTDIQVVRSVSSGLDSAAVVAVQDARFTPGLQEGRAVKVRFTLPVTFRLATPPPQAVLKADALLNRLGTYWSSAGLPAADSVSSDGATHQHVWVRPDAETERLVAIVERDTLRQIVTTAGAGPNALGPVRDLAEAVADRRVPQDSSGFFTTYALAVNGISSRADVAIDLERRTWTLRAPACVVCNVDGVPEGRSCMTTQPVLVGGIVGLQNQIRYPDEARRAGTQGRIVVQFVVTEDGAVDAVDVADNTARGRGARALENVAVEAIKAARFLPAMTAGGVPVPTRFTLPVTFGLQ